MKLLITFALLASGAFASAANNDFSGGVMLGTQNGATGKWEMARKDRAIDAALTYSLDSMYGFSLHADYLFENARHFGKTNLYYGVGGRLAQIRNGSDSDKMKAMIRIPVGLNYFSSTKTELFGEAAPTLSVLNGTGVGLDLGIGFRVNF